MGTHRYQGQPQSGWRRFTGTGRRRVPGRLPASAGRRVQLVLSALIVGVTPVTIARAAPVELLQVTPSPPLFEHVQARGSPQLLHLCRRWKWVPRAFA
jgi:hypothetical protein